MKLICRQVSKGSENDFSNEIEDLEEVLCFISIFPKADFSGHKLLVEKFHDPEYCPNPCCGLARKVQGSLWLFCQFLSENLTLQIF